MLPRQLVNGDVEIIFKHLAVISFHLTTFYNSIGIGSYYCSVVIGFKIQIISVTTKTSDESQFIEFLSWKVFGD